MLRHTYEKEINTIPKVMPLASAFLASPMCTHPHAHRRMLHVAMSPFPLLSPNKLAMQSSSLTLQWGKLPDDYLRLRNSPFWPLLQYQKDSKLSPSLKPWKVHCSVLLRRNSLLAKNKSYLCVCAVLFPISLLVINMATKPFHLQQIRGFKIKISFKLIVPYSWRSS